MKNSSSNTAAIPSIQPSLSSSPSPWPHWRSSPSQSRSPSPSLRLRRLCLSVLELQTFLHSSHLLLRARYPSKHHMVIKIVSHMYNHSIKGVSPRCPSFELPRILLKTKLKDDYPTPLLCAKPI
ncbi:hypothetical protein KC19_9G069400 [Ceratodon purpureus]|uniref:Uncharacterized protein n=1 Tax=Ceratodon purpureus TaxID=3225 RepID=A0A8T0GPH5_CERPU|nr:hypothetical protein KC19_9G069400 [Ceratodon purpureus]